MTDTLAPGLIGIKSAVRRCGHRGGGATGLGNGGR